MPKIQKVKSVKKKAIKESNLTIELEDGEVNLIMEALKNQLKKVKEESFYSPKHERGFYEIYIDRYYRLLNKLDVKLPKVIRMKLPKF